MDTIDLAKMVDTSEKNRHEVDAMDLCCKFDIGGWVKDDADKIVDRTLEVYNLSEWRCTDTWVGERVWFFNGQLMCVSHQPFRKSDTEYHWVSQDAYERFIKFLQDLIEPEQIGDANLLKIEGVTDIVGKRLQYESELIRDHTIVYHPETDRMYSVPEWPKPLSKDKDGAVRLTVTVKQGVTRDLRLDELIVPYNVDPDKLREGFESCKHCEGAGLLKEDESVTCTNCEAARKWWTRLQVLKNATKKIEETDDQR